MMVQYLRSEKLFVSAVVIQDEANMKTAEQQVVKGCVLRWILERFMMDTKELNIALSKCDYSQQQKFEILEFE